MSEEQQRESAGQPEAPKPSKKWSVLTIVLVILGGLLAFSCVTCVVGSWYLFRPGKPISPTEFITENTQGIVVGRADMNNPALRQFMAYAVNSAIEHGLVQEEGGRQFLRGTGTRGKSSVPSFTIVAAYEGGPAGGVNSFAALVLSEMPRIVRIGLQRGFQGFAKDAGAEDYQGAAILPGKNVTDTINADKSLPPTAAGILEASFVSVSDSCLFIGRQKTDVQAGLDAFAAPAPGESSQWPFLQLYRQADATATIHGALSNKDNALLAALIPPDRLEEARERITSAIFLDPRQVSSIVFSVTVMSDDDAVVMLNVMGVNEEAASQVAALVQSLAESSLEAAQNLPLRFTIAESQASGSQYTAKVNVSGLRALVDAYFAGLAARKQADEGPAPPPAARVPPSDSTREAPQEAPAQTP